MRSLPLRRRRGDVLSLSFAIPIVLLMVVSMVTIMRLSTLYLTLQDGAGAIARKLVMVEAAGGNPTSWGALQDANSSIQMLCAAKNIAHPNLCSVTVTQDTHHITVRATYPSVLTYLTGDLQRATVNAPVTATSTQRKNYLLQ